MGRENGGRSPSQPVTITPYRDGPLIVREPIRSPIRVLQPDTV
jgi:hypothetical protein